MKLKKIVVLFIMLMVSICTFTACTSSEYNKALKLMEQDKYEEAESIFIEISDYKDSAEMIDECKKCIANDYIERGYYVAARSIFEELGDYEYARECFWGIVTDHCSESEIKYKDTLNDGGTITVTIKLTPDNDSLVLYCSYTSGSSSGTSGTLSYRIEKENLNLIPIKADFYMSSYHGEGTANIDLNKIEDVLDWNVEHNFFSSIYTKYSDDSDMQILDAQIKEKFNAMFKYTYLIFDIHFGITLEDLGIGCE